MVRSGWLIFGLVGLQLYTIEAVTKLEDGSVDDYLNVSPRSSLTLDLKKNGYLVTIRVTSDSIQNLCGGALVSPTKIITSASCVIGAKPENIVCSFGPRDDFFSDNANTLKRRVSQVQVHPQYDVPVGNTDANIAILTLPWPVRITVFVRTVSLPRAQSEMSPDYFVGQTALVVNAKPFSGIASEMIKAKIISNEVCRRQYYIIRVPVQPFHTCLDLSAETEWTCYPGAVGVTGGPVVIPTNKSGRVILVGVENFNLGCTASPSQPIAYDVLTSVVSFLPWILKTAGLD